MCSNSFTVEQGFKALCSVMTLQLIYNSYLVAIGNSYISIHPFHRAKECVCLKSNLKARKENNSLCYDDTNIYLCHLRSSRKQIPRQRWGTRCL